MISASASSIRLVPDEDPDAAALVQQPQDEPGERGHVGAVDLVRPVPVVVGPAVGHHAHAHRPGIAGIRADRQAEDQVRVDLVGRHVHAPRRHRLPGLGVPVGPVVRQPGGGIEEEPGRALVDVVRADADQRDLGAGQTPARAQQEHRVRHSPGAQREARLQHAHARDDHRVVPAHPADRPARVHELAQRPGRDGRHPAEAALELLGPLQRDGRQPVAGGELIGAHAHGVHDRRRVAGPQVAEDGLHRRIVADVARAEQAEQAHSGRRRRPAPPRGGGTAGQDMLPFRPATRSSTLMLACTSPASCACPGCRVRARLAAHSHRYR